MRVFSRIHFMLRISEVASRSLGGLVLVLSIILVAALPSNTASADQTAKRQNYARDYTGEWGMDGCKYGSDFIFAETFIERAGEDICYIDSIAELESHVEVAASCWHEYKSVGSPVYRLQLTRDGLLKFNKISHEYTKCGPVPQDLIDYYTQKKDE
jgi:hypothetical protein